jgi:hypothetical protein
MGVTIDYENQTVSLSVTLTQAEYESLLFLLGMAMGTATKEKMTRLSYTCLRLMNKINEGNPNYTPYWVPKEDEHGNVPA